MLKTYIKEKTALINEALEKIVPAHKDAEIFNAMRYSLFAGGKRLRPILLMAAGDAVGGSGTKYLHVACGLEMIHTYSLIHDDLPAMDNDDFRRGKPTNHKIYGEGMAILAGDALLTGAFEAIFDQPGVQPAILLDIAKEIAAAAGATGMVGGQAIDLVSTGKTIEAGLLKHMHEAKTGALFKAALRSGAKLAGATQTRLSALTSYADKFGLAFQITDDILDVEGTQDKIGKPVGSDSKNNKVTYVSLYSLESAKMMARETVDSAIESLNELGPEADILRSMVRYLLERDN